MTAPPSPHILLAEDHAVARQAAVALLTGLGCTVDAVTTGTAAVEAFARQTYALVLMDAEMPGLDGYEAARRIRAMERGRRTPIVALSAHSGPEHQQRAREAGMDGHVVKPVTLAVLRGLLARWTGGGEAGPASITFP